MTDIILKVNKAYGEKRVFEDLSLTIKGGEITCVLGASGVGKTTLLNMLAGLTSFDGEIENKPKKVGYIFQEHRLLPNLTVEQNLLYAGAKAEEIDGILQKIGLLEHKDKRPSALSGGEKQRVSVARAFLSGADTLLLDEPFSSLDLALKTKMHALFAELWEEKKPTAVMVTHDIEEAFCIAHRIILLKDKKVALEITPIRDTFPSEYGAYDKQKEILIREIVKG